MGVGVAEIAEPTVTEQVGDMPMVALDNVGTHPLISTHHVTPVFRIELRGQFGGINEVAEHHGELPTFRFGGMRGSRARCSLRGALCLKRRLLRWLVRWR